VTQVNACAGIRDKKMTQEIGRDVFQLHSWLESAVMGYSPDGDPIELLVFPAGKASVKANLNTTITTAGGTVERLNGNGIKMPAGSVVIIRPMQQRSGGKPRVMLCPPSTPEWTAWAESHSSKRRAA
jgi:hypothetical protein